MLEGLLAMFVGFCSSFLKTVSKLFAEVIVPLGITLVWDAFDAILGRLSGIEPERFATV